MNPRSRELLKLGPRWLSESRSRSSGGKGDEADVKVARRVGARLRHTWYPDTAGRKVSARYPAASGRNDLRLDAHQTSDKASGASSGQQDKAAR